MSAHRGLWRKYGKLPTRNSNNEIQGIYIYENIVPYQNWVMGGSNQSTFKSLKRGDQIIAVNDMFIDDLVNDSVKEGDKYRLSSSKNEAAKAALASLSEEAILNLVLVRSQNQNQKPKSFFLTL